MRHCQLPSTSSLVDENRFQTDIDGRDGSLEFGERYTYDWIGLHRRGKGGSKRSTAAQRASQFEFVSEFKEGRMK